MYNDEKRGYCDMNKPLISAVITTHNRLNLLKKAVKSVKNQTYSNIEIIIVNDNSNDGTVEYLNELSDHDRSILHINISPEESHGGNYARNQGIKNASGEYIAFLDDDDEWLPEKIEKQIGFFQKCPSYGMVYCGRRIEKNNTVQEEQLPDVKFTGDLKETCFEGIFCVTSMMVVKKSILLDLNGFDEELKAWQEYDLCIRLADKTLIGYVNDPLIIYRIISSDKNRVSNNFYGWKKSVNYMEKKYAERLSRCNRETKQLWKLTILSDGACRAGNAGLKNVQREYLWKIFTITHKPKHLVKCLINTNISYKSYISKLLNQHKLGRS